ncbi:MAG: hypothetical protein K9I69_02210 [Ignavibacteriales bacterium]|nr:hypothetical protein [Ignavibacteriales bacterium]MCF8306704.1 hypothetical protein [Ignavibacteriales bacterium]MCF8316196.1 hypothetical protein [Ignavibacteriales bacterium]MCF8437780.1 hypothetical protein [Ignavibacteriales bacterium]
MSYGLKQKDTVAKTEYSNIITLDMGHDPSPPMEFTLYRNYRNPFNPTTTIMFSVTTPNHIELKVFDALGTELATLVGEKKDAGNYATNFNGTNLSAGMLLYRFLTGNFFRFVS